MGTIKCCGRSKILLIHSVERNSKWITAISAPHPRPIHTHCLLACFIYSFQFYEWISVQCLPFIPPNTLPFYKLVAAILLVSPPTETISGTDADFGLCLQSHGHSNGHLRRQGLYQRHLMYVNEFLGMFSMSVAEALRIFSVRLSGFCI